MGDTHIRHGQDTSGDSGASGAWVHEAQKQNAPKQKEQTETPEKLYERWYKAVTSHKVSFEDTLALAQKYSTKYDDPKNFHNQQELWAVKKWLKEQNDRPALTLDLSAFKSSGKNPTPDQLGRMIAKELGFDDSEIALYAAEQGKKPPGTAFYSSSGTEGGYFLKAAQKDLLGRVKIGEVSPGAIANLKKWLVDYHERLNPPNPINTYDYDKERTTTQGIVANVVVPAAGFVGGVSGGVGDIARGVGLPLHLFSSHTFMDSFADSARDFSQSCDLTGLYTTSEQQDGGIALLNIYTRGMGGVAPAMVPGFIASKFVGAAGEVSEVVGAVSQTTELGTATAETTSGLSTFAAETTTTTTGTLANVESTAVQISGATNTIAETAAAAQKVHQIAGEIVGAASSAGQVYDASITSQARQIALTELNDKSPTEKQITDRIQEIKEGKNIDPAIRHEIELRAMGSATIAAPIGAVYGRWLNDLSASTGPAFAPAAEESFALSARNEMVKGSIISVGQLYTNEESQVLFGAKTQTEASQEIKDGMFDAVITPALIGISMTAVAHRNVEHREVTEGLPQIEFKTGPEQKITVEGNPEDKEPTTSKRGSPEKQITHLELQRSVEEGPPPRYSEDLWNAYQRMGFDANFHPTADDYARAFSRLHDSGTVTQTVHVPKPGVEGPFLDAEGKSSFTVFAETALEPKEQTFRVYTIDGSDTKIYIPEDHAKVLDALHAKYGMQPGSYNAARPTTPEQALLALDRLPNSSYVKKIYLWDTPSPQDAWQAQEKNTPGFVSAATAAPDGSINIYRGASNWSTLSGYMSHEWVHEVGYTHPELEKTYEAGTSVEQKLAERKGEKIVNHRAYAEHPGENITVHVGEVGLHPDPDNLIHFGDTGPLRAYIAGAILQTTLESVAPEMRSPFHDQYVERAKYLESNCQEPAIAMLREALNDSDINLRADAFNTITGLKKPELLPLISGIDYTKEPSGVGLRGADAIRETIEQIPPGKRTAEHTDLLKKAEALYATSAERRIQELEPDLNSFDPKKQMAALDGLTAFHSPEAFKLIIAKGQTTDLSEVFTVALRSVDAVCANDPVARANAYKELVEPHIERKSSQSVNVLKNLDRLAETFRKTEGSENNAAVESALEVVSTLKPQAIDAAKVQLGRVLNSDSPTEQLRALKQIEQLGSPVEFAPLAVSTAQRTTEKPVLHECLDVLKNMKWRDASEPVASYKAIAEHNPSSVLDVMGSLFAIRNIEATKAYFELAIEHHVSVNWATVKDMAREGRTPAERDELWKLGTKALSDTELTAFRYYKSAEWPDHFVDIEDRSQLRTIVGYDKTGAPIYEGSDTRTESPSERDRPRIPLEEKPGANQSENDSAQPIADAFTTSIDAWKAGFKLSPQDASALIDNKPVHEWHHEEILAVMDNWKNLSEHQREQFLLQFAGIVGEHTKSAVVNSMLPSDRDYVLNQIESNGKETVPPSMELWFEKQRELQNLREAMVTQTEPAKNTQMGKMVPEFVQDYQNRISELGIEELAVKQKALDEQLGSLIPSGLHDYAKTRGIDLRSDYEGFSNSIQIYFDRPNMAAFHKVNPVELMAELDTYFRLRKPLEQNIIQANADVARCQNEIANLVKDYANKLGVPAPSTSFAPNMKSEAVYNHRSNSLALKTAFPADTPSLAQSIAHEMTHAEQSALLIRYFADQVGISGQPTPEQRSQLLDKLRSTLHVDVERSYVSAVLRGNGEPINPTERTRAESLAKSFQQEETDNVGFALGGGPGFTEKQLGSWTTLAKMLDTSAPISDIEAQLQTNGDIIFYRGIMPDSIKQLFSEAKSGNAIATQSLYAALKRYGNANIADVRDSRYGTYRAYQHEREAWAVGVSARVALDPSYEGNLAVTEFARIN
jgi:hypothetical protein